MDTNWIGNRAVTSASTDAISVVNPASEEPIAVVPRGCKADVDAAVAEARKAQPGWAALSPVERKNALRIAGDAMRAHARRSPSC